MSFERDVTLILLRHGRTGWNVEGRFQGQSDPPMDDVGRAESRRAAAEIARLGPVRVLTSDLRRARQTADIVAAACAVPVAADRRLREVDLGGWEGLSRKQAASRFPEEYAAWRDGQDVRRGGGETVAEAGERAAAALIELARSLDAGQAAVSVSHGLALQAALRVLEKRGAIVLDKEPEHLDNGRWAVQGVRSAADINRGTTGTLR